MKKNFPLPRSVRALFAMSALASLAACNTAPTAPSAQEHKAHYPYASSSQASGRSSPQGGQMEIIDQKAMCDVHKRMMDASPSERQVMMDERMKKMSPDMMEKHVQMMRQQCK